MMEKIKVGLQLYTVKEAMESATATDVSTTSVSAEENMANAETLSIFAVFRENENVQEESAAQTADFSGLLPDEKYNIYCS